MTKQATPAAQIVEFMNRIYHNGMTTTSGGNLSIIEPNGDVWISPSGIDKGTLTVDDIMCVKKDGTVIGRHRPSIEYPFHRSIYNMRNDIRAILHAHPPALVAFSVAKEIPNTAITPELAGLCGKIGFAPYAVPGSRLLGEKIAAEFAKGNGMVMMENHGIVLGADTMLHAFQKFEALDIAARTIYRALLIGKPNYLSDAQVAAELATVPPTVEGAVDADSAELRRSIADRAARCYRQRLFAAASGTIAVRCGRGFLVTPDDCDRTAIDPAEIVYVEDGKVENGKRMTRNAAFAAAVFARQPELNALIMAQPAEIMAYAVSGVKFDPRVIPESYLVLRDAPSYAFGERAAATERLSPRDPVLLIGSDCVVAAGKSLHEAFDRMEVLDYSARATIMAERLGGMQPMNDEAVAEIIDAFKLIP